MIAVILNTIHRNGGALHLLWRGISSVITTMTWILYTIHRPRCNGMRMIGASLLMMSLLWTSAWSGRGQSTQERSLAKSALSRTQRAAPVRGRDPVASLPISPLLREIAAIRKRGVLRVAIHAQDQFPFFFRDAYGVQKGFDWDAAHTVAKALGVNLRLVTNSRHFEDVVDQVASGRADLAISTLSFTPARAQRVIYASRPYMKLRKGVIVNRLHLASHPGASLNALLAGGLADPDRPGFGIIGVLAGSIYADFTFSRFPKARYKPFASWGALAQAVRDGHVTAAFCSQSHVDNAAKNHFLFIHPRLLSEEDNLYVIGHPRLPHLAQWAQAVIFEDPALWDTYEAAKTYYQKEKDS